MNKSLVCSLLSFPMLLIASCAPSSGASSSEPSEASSSSLSSEISSSKPIDRPSSSSSSESVSHPGGWKEFGRVPYEKFFYLSEIEDERNEFRLSASEVSNVFHAYEDPPSILASSFPSVLATARVAAPEGSDDHGFFEQRLIDYRNGQILDSFLASDHLSAYPIVFLSEAPLAVAGTGGNYSLIDLSGNFLLSYLRSSPTLESVVTRAYFGETQYIVSARDSDLNLHFFVSSLVDGLYEFDEVAPSALPDVNAMEPLLSRHINSLGYCRESGEDLILYDADRNYLNRIVPSSFAPKEGELVNSEIVYTDSAIYYFYSEKITVPALGEGEKEEETYRSYAYGVDLATGNVYLSDDLPYVVEEKRDYRKKTGDAFVYDGALLKIRMLDGEGKLSAFEYLLGIDETIDASEPYEFDPLFIDSTFYVIDGEIVVSLSGDFFVLSEEGGTRFLPLIDSIVYFDGRDIIVKDDYGLYHIVSPSAFLSGETMEAAPYEKAMPLILNGSYVAYSPSGETILSLGGEFDAAYASCAEGGVMVETTPDEEETAEIDEGSFRLTLYGASEPFFEHEGRLDSIAPIAAIDEVSSLYRVDYLFRGRAYQSYFLVDWEEVI